MFYNELTKLKSAYFLDEWIQLNEELWGLKAERVRYTLHDKDLPTLEGVLYLTKNGKIKVPPENACIPLRFIPTSTEKECQLYSQRLEVMKLFAEDVKKRGWEGTLSLPPGFVDGRAFQWLSIDTSVAYTFITKLPYNEDELDTSVRKNIRKAEKLSYIVTRTEDWEDVCMCLSKTANFQGFDELFSKNDLNLASKLLGEKYLFAHIAKDSKGYPVSAQVKVALPDGICIDWLAGTDRTHINNGVNQLLYARALQDVLNAGSKYFNYCGANIETVAMAKSKWGFKLVPYITIPDKSLKVKIKSALCHVRGLRPLYHRINRII